MASFGSDSVLSMQTVQTFISIAGFILSVAVSLFISGMRWGETRGDLKSIGERLSRIEGMFEMKLKEPPK